MLLKLESKLKPVRINQLKTCRNPKTQKSYGPLAVRLLLAELGRVQILRRRRVD